MGKKFLFETTLET